jgi:predicted RNA-binding protein with PIN domain
VLEKWNQDTIKEAGLLRIAARSLYTSVDASGKMQIKKNLEPAQLNAAQSTNLAADRMVRLATGSSTENSSVSTRTLEPLKDEDFLG